MLEEVIQRVWLLVNTRAEPGQSEALYLTPHPTQEPLQELGLESNVLLKPAGWYM